MAWRGRWPVGYSPVSAAPSCCWCTPLWSMILPSATWRKTPTARCRCGIGWRRPGGARGLAAAVVLLLSVWTFAVAIFSRRMPLDAVARVLAVMGMIAFGFLLFILFTSNPFSRGLPQYPIDGRDLNPLLQDIGMIFHPPILYGLCRLLGGLCLRHRLAAGGPAGYCTGALVASRTQAAWMFLTRHRAGLGVGIYELGWGGWWFWDPVENASFMPWLVGTALLHSRR